VQYRYDGSVDGLLTAVALALRDAESPSAIRPPDTGSGLLFEEERPVSTDPDLAASLLEQVRNDVSPDAANRLLRVLMAEDPGIAVPMLAYVRLGLRYGAKVDRYHSDPGVHAVHALARKVGREIHRFQGLLRFRRLRSGRYWGPFEPRYNVVCPVALHFRRRLPDQRWILHDLGRDCAVTWDGRRLSEADTRGAPGPGSILGGDELAGDEPGVQAMWRAYFQAIAIPERRNPGRQAALMPKRYWRYLVEMDRTR
jgi:probable DNA metabolism protein